MVVPRWQRRRKRSQGRGLVWAGETGLLRLKARMPLTTGVSHRRRWTRPRTCVHWQLLQHLIEGVTLHSAIAVCPRLQLPLVQE